MNKILSLDELATRCDLKFVGRTVGDCVVLNEECGRVAFMLSPGVRELLSGGETGVDTWSYVVHNFQDVLENKYRNILFGRDGFLTKDEAVAELEATLALGLAKHDVTKAFWYFTATRVGKRGQEEIQIGIGKILNRFKYPHNNALAVFTSEQLALEAAKVVRSESDRDFHVKAFDMRVAPYKKLFRLLYLLQASLYGIKHDREQLVMDFIACLADTPVVVNPQPVYGKYRGLFAMQPDFVKILKWADATVSINRYIDLPAASDSFTGSILKYAVKSRGKKALPLSIRPPSMCDCGKSAVLTCVECKQPTCFDCLKAGKCSFCRGE